MLQTAVTSAPSHLAIWTANVPTPPDAPWISTCWPGCTLALSRRPCSAVSPPSGVAAACSNEMFAGFSATAAEAQRYSASAPLRSPNTSSPGLKSSTSGPTASTVPAKSTPSNGDFGRKKPVSGRAISGYPVSQYQSSRLSAAARTRTSTPSSVSGGCSTSVSSIASGEP